jgi:hypothetical protein
VLFQKGNLKHGPDAEEVLIFHRATGRPDGFLVLKAVEQQEVHDSL